VHNAHHHFGSALARGNGKTMNTFKRIIAATDLSDCVTVALSYAAKAIARKFETDLTLVHANVIAPMADAGRDVEPFPM
jgi:nucleotide-binding universal stress UspA family protein